MQRPVTSTVGRLQARHQLARKSGTDHGFPLCEDQIIELWLHRLLHRFAWPPRLPSAVGPKPPKNRGLSPIILPIIAIDGPDHPVIQDVTAQLVQDDSVLKSIRRYRGSDLIWFGEWTAPNGGVHTGGSNKTIAYKRAAVLLREKVSSELRPTPSHSSPVNSNRQSKVQFQQKEPNGCLPIVALFAFGLIATLGTLSWIDRLVA